MNSKPMCGLDNLDSIPAVIFCDLVAFLILGAQGCRNKRVGDEPLPSHHQVCSILLKTPTVTEAINVRPKG
jgi:hypothetical protein